MLTSKMSTKGQLTLPKTIREYLKLKTGDAIEFLISDKGQVLLTPKNLNIDDIFGMVKTEKIVTVEEMNAAISRKYQL